MPYLETKKKEEKICLPVLSNGRLVPRQAIKVLDSRRQKKLKYFYFHLIFFSCSLCSSSGMNE